MAGRLLDAQHRQRQADLVVAASPRPPRSGRPCASSVGDQVLRRGLARTSRSRRRPGSSCVRRRTPPARKPERPHRCRRRRSPDRRPDGLASATTAPAPERVPDVVSGRRCARPPRRRTATQRCTAASRRRPARPAGSAPASPSSRPPVRAATSPPLMAITLHRADCAAAPRATRPGRRTGSTCPPISWPCSWPLPAIDHDVFRARPGATASPIAARRSGSTIDVRTRPARPRSSPRGSRPDPPTAGCRW